MLIVTSTENFFPIKNEHFSSKPSQAQTGKKRRGDTGTRRRGEKDRVKLACLAFISASPCPRVSASLLPCVSPCRCYLLCDNFRSIQTEGRAAIGHHPHQLLQLGGNVNMENRNSTQARRPASARATERTFDSAYGFSFSIALGLILFIGGRVLCPSLGGGAGHGLGVRATLLDCGVAAPLFVTSGG